MEAIPAPARVLDSRRYAARFRIGLAVFGIALVAISPGADPHPATAAAGLGIILLTGIVEFLVTSERWLRIEEAVSCSAGVLIVGFGYGHVTVIVLLWLTAASVGVLARGGRVGSAGRILLILTLFSPVISTGTLSAENIGLIFAVIALMLSTGRLAREAAGLLRRARYDADHDGLTGAFVASVLRERLDERAAAATRDAPLSVLLVDLDDFARVNKRRGHAAGDAVLLQTVQAIDAVLSPGDLLARIGGDTFVVVSASEGILLADEISTSLATSIGAEKLSASIGISRAPEHGTEAEGLMGAADVALRLAKRAGKSRAVCYSGDPLTAGADGGAHGALHALIRGETLTMHVQPIVALDGTIHAFEALARMGAQGPLHWLELAEELGLRADLELACVRQALALVPRLPGGASLTINMSIELVADPMVERLLADEPQLDRVIIEITEETLAREDDDASAAITRLQALGVRFAVDDIGAGYSGLRQLATLRPAYLKLDRGLITHIDGDPTRQSLVAALTSYAAATGAMLVAEGIETAEELDVLREIGTPLLQGYLLARPAAPWPDAPPQPGQIRLVA